MEEDPRWWRKRRWRWRTTPTFSPLLSSARCLQPPPVHIDPAAGVLPEFLPQPRAAPWLWLAWEVPFPMVSSGVFTRQTPTCRSISFPITFAHSLNSPLALFNRSRGHRIWSCMIATKGLKILGARFFGFGAYELFVVFPTRKPLCFKIEIGFSKHCLSCTLYLNC
jgi:hypothetical protein